MLVNRRTLYNTNSLAYIGNRGKMLSICLCLSNTKYANKCHACKNMSEITITSSYSTKVLQPLFESSDLSNSSFWNYKKIHTA